MKRSLPALFVFVFSTLLASHVAAQEEDLSTQEEDLSTATVSISSDPEFTQALGMCPIAVAFGILSINYEYLFNQTHGLVVRVDYEAVPEHVSDESIDATGKGLILNYRWHLSNSMNSVFLGLYGRYRVYDGTRKHGSLESDFRLSERTVGLNVGKRWVWNNGINIAFGVGYGLSDVRETTQNRGASSESALTTFKDGYSFYSPSSYGELSAGYAF